MGLGYDVDEGISTVKCIKCRKPMEVDAWYLAEIEAGREEQMHDECKEAVQKRYKIKKVV